MHEAFVQQQPVPDERFGRLNEFSGSLEDHAAIERAFEEDGYLFLRGVLRNVEQASPLARTAVTSGDACATSAVLAARAEVFGRLHEVGEIEAPPIDGIFTGTSRREQVASDLGRFWKSVSEGPALRHVTHGAALRAIMSRVLGEPARPHDLLYLRPTAIGWATALHFDYPFFAGSSRRIFTAWIPLGDVPLCDGPLVVVEGSHRFRDLIDPVLGVSYAPARPHVVLEAAAYAIPHSTEPLAVAEERGTRLLSADFRAGDLVVFSGLTMHGSLDNHSPQNRVRLSVDVRFQPAADPSDDGRYFGPNPTGSKGGGYADMRGAKPLVV